MSDKPMTKPNDRPMCTHCRPWPDGECDFGCPCDDCKPITVPMTDLYSFLPPCGVEHCDSSGCGPCQEAARDDMREHERAHSASRLG